MADYQKMYNMLSHEITYIRQRLEDVQELAEKVYLQTDEVALELQDRFEDPDKYN